MSRARVAVLISGGGSNMAALIRAAQDPAYPAEIALVLSNNAEAGGLEKARAAGVPTLVIDHRPFGKDRQAHEAAIHLALTDHGIEVVALAGYMRLLTPWLVGRWSGRMLNIHPSLLPKYPGLHTHARALEAGDPEAGCTVHLVIDEVDAGEILGQARVPVLDGDTPETLAARVLEQEHRLYPAVLADFVRTLPA
ncbi:phosphoribosylglycinamide formyltransferase [Brevundimonas sp. 2R-24]|uniref:Phosphoribosylglycinamide formyltransferase n=1 Tax=Peiella sedimenti TaxID=3061083 RepID=A0ABT8SMY5_9CAUL|nr:phosphoribosylglycinamide formyltransferase [Caulobacteraceae bacterium XZ-24]